MTRMNIRYRVKQLSCSTKASPAHRGQITIALGAASSIENILLPVHPGSKCNEKPLHTLNTHSRHFPEYDHNERLPQVAYCPVFWPCSTSLLFLIRYSPRTFSGFCGLEHMAHRQSTCTLVHPSELCETYCSLAISFKPSSRYGVIFSFKYVRAGAPPATLGRTLSSPAGFPPVVVDELWVSAELPMGVVLELIVVVFGRCEGEEVRKGYCVARVLSGIWRCLCRRLELLELGLF